MLSKQQQFEIQKFFINALLENLKDGQTHDKVLNAQKVPPTTPSAADLAKGYPVNEVNALIIASAIAQAMSKTQQQTSKITGANFTEVTQEIHAYKSTVLPTILAGVNSTSEPWSTIQANLKTLDAKLEVPGFTEKYKDEFEFVGKVSFFAALGGLAIYGLYTALNNTPANGSGNMPPPPSSGPTF